MKSEESKISGPKEPTNEKAQDKDLKLEEKIAKVRATAIMAEKIKRYGELKKEIGQYVQRIEKMKNSLEKIKAEINKNSPSNPKTEDEMNIVLDREKEKQIIEQVLSDLIQSLKDAITNLKIEQEKLTRDPNSEV